MRHGLFSVLFLVTAILSHSAEPKALPFDQPTIPTTLDVVTFRIHAEGEDHKMLVTAAPNILRVDEAADGYSVIYHPASESYVGLEHRNYTWWEFSWPAVRAAVENTKRYETRLRDVGSEGLGGYFSDNSNNGTNAVVSALLDTNSPSVSASNSPAPSTAPSTASDDAGYVWRPTTDRKRIAGYDCVHWAGESVSGDPIDAWCYAGLLPAVQNAITQLQVINEPMALVPVRTLVPPIVFAAAGALFRGGVTPVLINWGGDEDKSNFELISIKKRDGDPRIFTVPKLYVKTTLITMDGIGDQKPPEKIPGERPEKSPSLPPAKSSIR